MDVAKQSSKTEKGVPIKEDVGSELEREMVESVSHCSLHTEPCPRSVCAVKPSGHCQIGRTMTTGVGKTAHSGAGPGYSFSLTLPGGAPYDVLTRLCRGPGLRACSCLTGGLRGCLMGCLLYLSMISLMRDSLVRLTVKSQRVAPMS